MSDPERLVHKKRIWKVEGKMRGIARQLTKRVTDFPTLLDGKTTTKLAHKWQRLNQLRKKLEAHHHYMTTS